MPASTLPCSTICARFVPQGLMSPRRSPAKCGSFGSTISSRKAAKFAPMVGSFTICTLSKSRHPRNRGGLGTIIKSSRLSVATKPSDRSVKADAISFLHSCTRDHDHHSRADPRQGETERHPTQFPLRRRLSAADRFRRHYCLCRCGERGRAIYFQQIQEWI